MNNNDFPFKEGDWIAPNNNGFCIGLIVSISDYMCSFEDDNGINIMSKEYVENNYHL